MNTPSPLVPKGTHPEPRRRSHLTAVFIILFIHVGVLAGLLLQGCKDQTEANKTAVDTGVPPLPTAPDTNPMPAMITSLPPSNGVAALPPGLPPGAAPAPYGNPAGVGQFPPAGNGGLPTAPTITPPPPMNPEPVISNIPSSEHTILKGETGAVIAKKYGMSWKAIEAANPGLDARRLKIGQKLIIPAKSVSAGVATHGEAPVAHGDAAPASSTATHTVKSGETLAKIAKAHGLSVKALKSANGLKLDSIKVGQKLKIPVKAAPAPAVETPAPAPTLALPPSLPPAGTLPPPVTIPPVEPGPGSLPPPR